MRERSRASAAASGRRGGPARARQREPRQAGGRHVGKGGQRWRERQGARHLSLPLSLCIAASSSLSLETLQPLGARGVDGMSRGARVCDGGSDAPTLRDWLAAGPYTLALSSSFFGFYSHAGSLAALEEVGLTPAAITGSSAGALAGAAWAAGLDARDGMRDFMLRTRREDAMRPFWRRPCAGLMKLNVGPLER